MFIENLAKDGLLTFSLVISNDILKKNKKYADRRFFT